jgi:protein SCO1/2
MTVFAVRRSPVILRPMKRLYLLLALAACNSAPPLLSPSGYSGAELPTPLPMPDLVLTDSQGEPYHLAESTRGKVALVFFGYTSCPDICPVHLASSRCDTPGGGKRRRPARR